MLAGLLSKTLPGVPKQSVCFPVGNERIETPATKRAGCLPFGKRDKSALEKDRYDTRYRRLGLDWRDDQGDSDKTAISAFVAIRYASGSV